MFNQQVQIFEHNEHWEQFMQRAKQDEMSQSMNSDELETIQEEDDEFQYFCQVEKLSKSGIMYNKRVLALDQEYLCYYQNVQTQMNKQNSISNKKPKARILIKDIQDITINNNKPNVIRIVGSGTVIRREKKITKNQNYSLTFRFANSQIAELWYNIIQTAKEANKLKSYMVTFDDLMKHSRSNSSS